MNAPTSHQHLTPAVAQREVPAEMIAALQARFGTNCSTALVIREQHGRDESPFTHVPPPAAVVFASRMLVACGARMHALLGCECIPTNTTPGVPTRERAHAVTQWHRTWKACCAALKCRGRRR